MEKNNFVKNLPLRIATKAHLDILLSKLVEIKGSDLFLSGDSFVWAHVNSKKIKLTNRVITNKEVTDVLTDFYGIDATSQLGMPSPINTDLEYKEITEPGRPPIRHRFRVNAVYGKKAGRLVVNIVIRSISAIPPKASDLDISQDILDACMKSHQGLILVVGGTGNGKSTTLAAILRHLLESEDSNKHIVSIEDPIEYVYDSISSPNSIMNQLELGRCIKSFSEGLRNSLRMAPTDILIGESRDFETVSTSIDASLTGHNLYSTLHANSCSETIQRMISFYPESLQAQAQQNLIQSMRMIIAQRLIPTVNGGRVAVREVLIFNKEIKDHLSLSKSIAKDTFEMVKKFGRTMVSDAERHYEAGTIDVDALNKIKLNYAE